jgi:hypothetical protein
MCEEGVPLDFSTADALVYPDCRGDTMVEDVKKDTILRYVSFKLKLTTDLMLDQ